jgi:hypothetical protein
VVVLVGELRVAAEGLEEFLPVLRAEDLVRQKLRDQPLPAHVQHQLVYLPMPIGHLFGWQRNQPQEKKPNLP